MDKIVHYRNGPSKHVTKSPLVYRTTNSLVFKWFWYWKGRYSYPRYIWTTVNRILLASVLLLKSVNLRIIEFNLIIISAVNSQFSHPVSVDHYLCTLILYRPPVFLTINLFFKLIFRESELFIYFTNQNCNILFFQITRFASWKAANRIKAPSVLSSFLNEAKILSVNCESKKTRQWILVSMPDKRKESVTSSGKNSKRAKVEEPDTEHLSYDPVHFIR